MTLYFSMSQIPELAGLKRPQRQAVYRCALEAFYGEDSTRVWAGLPWIAGGLLAGAVVGWFVTVGAELTHAKLPFILGGGLVGAAVGVFIAAQLQTARLRPYLQRVLQERWDEIAQIK